MGSWEVYIFTQIVLLMVKEPSDVVYNFFQVEDISVKIKIIQLRIVSIKLRFFCLQLYKISITFC